MTRKCFTILSLLAVLSMLFQGRVSVAQQSVSLQGQFYVIWGDPATGVEGSRELYFLTTQQGEQVQLSLDTSILAQAGGVIALNRKPVVVEGGWVEANTLMQVQSIALAQGVSASPQSVIGPQPWISIMCKFPDVPDEPKNLAYFQGMYSSTFPGLDHYWREVSFNLANVQGSNAAGWFTLPYPRSHYIPGGDLDHDAAVHDCTNVADPYVDFSPYIGVNLMFNSELDGYAWGGGHYLCLDGNCGYWSVTWEPPWGYESVSVIAHEGGHGFGLPHSSGNYGETYDNVWDVMSDSWDPCYRGAEDPTYGCIGQHTIAYHKDILGWIAPAQKYTANPGTAQTITLERLALPQSGNYLLAVVPIPGLPGQFYTVEARQLVGYDSHNPGSAVIIHHVDPNRDNPAHVIDIDGNGETGDAGAMWLPGETFNDVSNHILIKVLSATPTGFVVLINTGNTPVSDVGITGPSQGQNCTDYTFTAAISPTNATAPITYLWQASGQEPVTHTNEITDTVTYRWPELGTQTITVTASNEGGSATATHAIQIDTFIPCLTLSGPRSAWPGVTVTFTATVTPLTTTVPLTYTWVVDGQSPITQTNGLVDTVSYAWLAPGVYELTVTATGPDGVASDTTTVVILASRLFLPIALRH